MQPAIQLLASCPLRRFLKEHKGESRDRVLVLEVHTTVSDALAALAHKRVLSAPLVDAEQELFLGFISVSDILRAFIDSDSEELLVVRHQIGNEGPDAPGTRLLSKEGPVATGGRFADRTLASIAGRGSDGHLLLVSPSQVVDEDAYGEYDEAPKPGELSLLDVVRGSFLHAGSHWPVCHRAAVIEEAWNKCLRVTNIVSQSDVLHFVHDAAARGELGAALDVPLSSVGLVAADPPPPSSLLGDESSPFVKPAAAPPPPMPFVACVDGATPSLDAFASLLRLGVSALGVVGDDGALVANLSASDVRCVLPDRWGVLALPVRRLLEQWCGAGWGVTSRHGGAARAAGRGVIAVDRRATLRDAICSIVEHRIHHVFVVDDLKRPTGIVTTTDVLRLLVSPT